VNQDTATDRLVWAFWVAAAIAFVGGILPLAFGGTSSRMAIVAVPFTIGAAALASCGFVHRQGRAVTAVLYFVAGLALVYGMLAMFAVPLELAVLGSCAPAPAPCAGGVGRPLTVGENSGMGFAAGFALVSLFVGFFGLMVVFRRLALPAPAAPVQTTMPPRGTAAKPAPAPAVEAAAKPANGSTPTLEKGEPELPAHVEEELPELPPPESDPPKT
jgi:hypothetical protein